MPSERGDSGFLSIKICLPKAPEWVQVKLGLNHKIAKFLILCLEFGKQTEHIFLLIMTFLLNETIILIISHI